MAFLSHANSIKIIDYLAANTAF